jgi:hypothetical protein
VKNGQIFAHKSTARGGLDLEYLDETSRRKVSLRERADMEQQIGKKLKHFTDYASRETLGQVHPGGFMHHSIRMNPDGTSTTPSQLSNAERKQRIAETWQNHLAKFPCKTSRNRPSARFLDVQRTARCTDRRRHQSGPSPSFDDEKGHAKIQREISPQRFGDLVLYRGPKGGRRGPILLSFAFKRRTREGYLVLKPSPFTPLTVLRISDYIRELLPSGVLNTVTGGDELGPWMTSHPGIDHISFTGSTETGKRVLASASPTLKHVSLELGGNDPGIVLADADPNAIAEGLFNSMFLLSGQGCICLKRLYIHENIYSALTDALVAVARSVRVGDGFDPDAVLGPVQNHLQYQRLQSAWREITKSGATILFRGDVSANGKGFFFSVTLLDNPPEDASFVTHEIFGPIRSVFKYKTVDEAIRHANNTSYGLGPQSGRRIPMNFNE